MIIKDSTKFLEWPAGDRAAIVFESLADPEDKRAALRQRDTSADWSRRVSSDNVEDER